MATDWWDVYGPRRSAPAQQRCWDCNTMYPKDDMGWDGVTRVTNDDVNVP